MRENDHTFLQTQLASIIPVIRVLTLKTLIVCSATARCIVWAKSAEEILSIHDPAKRTAATV